MNALMNAYNELRENHLTEGQYDFSRRWLGRDRSYLSSMKARRQVAGTETMVRLAKNLTRAMVTAKAERRNDEAALLDRLSGKVLANILAA
ncbi:DUF6626 family protein [Paramagnetospirillum magneticum]|uniref:Uncharacterized protein n=1 Tax=Paramagnetospirillum magneticum (strain ATCC 700264 / AMB-1) TaxID=342108 RepID=Q2W5F2_PARM1|nr:DUF6626 family protein [Paramagnetospirillum magneticum]BAE50923.1 hypothetical protein amb2119 [Paramagnetospirillum magneticum AMB-1]